MKSDFLDPDAINHADAFDSRENLTLRSFLLSDFDPFRGILSGVFCCSMHGDKGPDSEWNTQNDSW